MKRRDYSLSAYERVKKHRYVTGNVSSDSYSDDSDVETNSTKNSPTDWQASGEVSRPAGLEKESLENFSPLDLNLSFESDSSRKSPEQENYQPLDENDVRSPVDSEVNSNDESDYYSNNSCSTCTDTDFSDGGDGTEELFSRFRNPIEDLKSGLRSWSLKNRITLKALSELLALILSWLTTHCIFLHKWLTNLPKDARTLLGTTRGENYKKRPMLSQGGKFGQFVYFGLKDTLQQIVDEKYFPIPSIPLVINIDGLPLFKSSSTNFWPILCKIFDWTYCWRPFSVALYCGPGKPKDINDFLSDFVEEVRHLLRDGISVKGRHYEIKILCYACDTPARAFIKCVAGHGGYFCCERCEVQGMTINKKRVYPDNNCTLRTEEDFLNKTQKHHHTGTSPLTRIPGFMPVKTFLLDFMHLVCLGIMKRLLAYYWVGLNKKQTTTLPARSISLISKRLADIKSGVPSEFPRKIRELDELARFKATEFRFFLLYCGPIVLQDILETKLYKHFLLLHTATRVLCCPKSCTTMANYAKSLFRHFFDWLPECYGRDSQIINMHNILHLADDVINFECSLDMLSAFDFENELGKIKRTLRSSHRPLGQYCRRRKEFGAPPPPTKRFHLKPLIKKNSRGGRFLVVQYLDFKLTSVEPNNFVLLNNESVVEISSISKENKQIMIHGTVWQQKEDIFAYPCKSSKLNEWEIKNPARVESSWKLEDVKAKLIHFKITQEGCVDKHYALAVLHSVH